jgi:hypothetical protein
MACAGFESPTPRSGLSHNNKKIDSYWSIARQNNYILSIHINLAGDSLE